MRKVGTSLFKLLGIKYDKEKLCINIHPVRNYFIQVQQYSKINKNISLLLLKF